MDKIILPPALLGILGGGQLGLMFTIAAKQMGYRVMVADADINCPASVVADEYIGLPFDNVPAIIKKMANCSAVTIESENIPPSLLLELAKYTQVTPSANIVQILQNRILEKNWINKTGLNTTTYSEINTIPETGKYEKYIPGILKTITFGYDGKGQEKIHKSSDLPVAFKNLGQVPCILEKFVPIDKEISVIVCRLNKEQYSIYPVIENIHKDGILDYSKIPANIPVALAKKAHDMALKLANDLDYVGVLTVEMFVVQNTLYINELAPRPHNSGHFSLDACETSQFEQQLRIMCGLAPAKATLLQECCMANLLGRIWKNKAQPNWLHVLQEQDAKLYLYGKAQAKLARKMGHFTVLADKVDKAFIKAVSIREKLELGNKL